MSSTNAKALPGGAILTYHEVMPESNYSYCVPCQVFKQHLMLVQRYAAQETGAQAQVTFDDGERSQYLHAFPLLSQGNIRATFFVTPALIGVEARFLGWSKLRELQEAGHSIQSHGWSHKFLTSCGQQELAYELRASKERLEDRLGRAVLALSAPGGRWDRRVVEGCAAAGYRCLYVSEPWIALPMSGIQVMGRFMVRRTTTLPELARILNRDRGTLWKLKMRSGIKQCLMGLMGDGVYHRLWCRLTGYVDFEEARQNSTS